jgi:hypothetical protein
MHPTEMNSTHPHLENQEVGHLHPRRRWTYCAAIPSLNIVWLLKEIEDRIDRCYFVNMKNFMEVHVPAGSAGGDVKMSSAIGSTGSGWLPISIVIVEFRWGDEEGAGLGDRCTVLEAGFERSARFETGDGSAASDVLVDGPEESGAIDWLEGPSSLMAPSMVVNSNLRWEHL